MNINTVRDYIIFYYIINDPNLIKNSLEFKDVKIEKIIEKIKFPSDFKDLKFLFLKHLEFIFYYPFKDKKYKTINIFVEDALKYYGELHPKTKLLFEKIKTLDIDFIEKTRYGWVFRISNDTNRYYLPDEYFYFHPEEKKFFIDIIDKLSKKKGEITLSNNVKLKELYSQLGPDGQNLLDHYLFIFTIFDFLKPNFHRKYKNSMISIFDLREGKDYEIIEKDGKKKILFSIDMLFFFRRLILMYDFFKYFYGPYGFFLRDREDVEEIIQNFVGRFTTVMKGGKISSTYVPFTNDEIKFYIDKMLIHKNVSLSTERYIVNSELPSGDRTAFVHAIISTDHAFNVRIFKQIPLSVMDFYFFQNFGIDLIALMSIFTNISATIFYSGGTGTGKTTALNAFIGLIPKNRFLIIVEDVKEMDPFHPEEFTRREVAPREEVFDELVKAALRHSPDSVIFQEIRTPKVMEAFLDAVNTGHAGSLSTFHADNINELFQRIKGFNLDPQSLEGLHLIYFIRRFEYKGSQLRRVSSLVEITKVERDEKGEIDIKNKKIYYLTPMILLKYNKKNSKIELEETLMPMMFNIPEKHLTNSVLYTNFTNKYKGVNPQDKIEFLKLQIFHSIFFYELFKWIKRHHLWRGKLFVKYFEDVGNIEITLKEFLPEIVSLFYAYMEDTSKGSLKERLDIFLRNLDKIGNIILESLFIEVAQNKRIENKIMDEKIERIFELIKLQGFNEKDKDDMEFFNLVKEFAKNFRIDSYGPIIGSRINMRKFLEMISIK